MGPRAVDSKYGAKAEETDGRIRRDYEHFNDECMYLSKKLSESSRVLESKIVRSPCTCNRTVYLPGG